MTIQFLDVIEPRSVTDESEPMTDELTCTVCGKALEYRGSGRKPKYCADHRPNGARPQVKMPSSNRDTKLRQELSSMFAMIGMGVMLIDSYDGIVVIDRAPASVDALITLAEHNPKIRKMLEGLVNVSVWGAVATAVAGIAGPIAAHHGLLPVPVESMERQFISDTGRAQLEKLRANDPVNHADPIAPDGEALSPLFSEAG